MTVGAVVSAIVMVCNAVALFPAASVAVHATLMLPSAYLAVALFVIVRGPMLSEAVGVPIDATVVRAPVASLLMFAGAAIFGATVSIVYFCEPAVPIFPAASLAKYRRVVVEVIEMDELNTLLDSVGGLLSVV